MATELPAGCLPCQPGKHLSPGLPQHCTEKVKAAQAAEIAAGAGGWLQANNIPCLIMPCIKLKFADALITARHSAHTASLQPRSSVQTPEEKPCLTILPHGVLESLQTISPSQIALECLCIGSPCSSQIAQPPPLQLPGPLLSFFPSRHANVRLQNLHRGWVKHLTSDVICAPGSQET